MSVSDIEAVVAAPMQTNGYIAGPIDLASRIVFELGPNALPPICTGIAGICWNEMS